MLVPTILFRKRLLTDTAFMVNFGLMFGHVDFEGLLVDADCVAL